MSEEELPSGQEIKERYRIRTVIGRGAYGVVYLVEECKRPDILWALKEIYEGNLDGEDRQNALAAFQKEHHQSFTTIDLPEKAPGDLRMMTKWIDFHEFHRVYFADYLGLLEHEARARGITVPFYHNKTGWVYRHALEYPVNISMYTRIAEKSPSILLAADHIPEYVNYRNIHHGTLVTGGIAALKNGHELSYVAEMQAGIREDNVITYPIEGVLEENIHTALAPKASILAPVMMPLQEGKGRIIYSTAYIVGVKQEKEKRLVLSVYREKRASSQIMLEPGFNITVVHYCGRKIDFTRDARGRVTLTLSHKGNIEELVLSGS